MAHFAKLDNNNIVTQVIVVSNHDTSDASGQEKEYIGAAFCERLFGGRWVQTSYNGNFRKNYAGIGFKYDSNRDAFIPPKPENQPLFVLDEETCNWVPPPIPDDYDKTKQWEWDYENHRYIELTRELILARKTESELLELGITLDANSNPIDNGAPL